MQSCSGGALPHQLSPRVSPWPSRQRFLIFWRGVVTSFRAHPMKSVGPLSKNVRTHHTNSRGPWIASPEALCSVQGARPPPARSCPSPRPLTWKEWKRYQKAQALMTL